MSGHESIFPPQSAVIHLLVIMEIINTPSLVSGAWPHDKKFNNYTAKCKSADCVGTSRTDETLEFPVAPSACLLLHSLNTSYLRGCW